MMNKVLLPMVILIGSLIIAMAIYFRIDEKATFIPEAKAKVAGMDYSDLRKDSDFKIAVTFIIENNCTVSGYADGERIYNADISCK